MCRKAHLADIRYALHDYCEDHSRWEDDDLQLEDLLMQFENPKTERKRATHSKRMSNASEAHSPRR